MAQEANFAGGGEGFTQQLDAQALAHQEIHLGEVAQVDLARVGRGAGGQIDRDLWRCDKRQGGQQLRLAQRLDAEQFLRDLLADGPISTKQVKADATGAGYAWRTIERAKRDLGIEAVKAGMKEGWQWFLPKTAKE